MWKRRKASSVASRGAVRRRRPDHDPGFLTLAALIVPLRIVVHRAGGEQAARLIAAAIELAVLVFLFSELRRRSSDTFTVISAGVAALFAAALDAHLVGWTIFGMAVVLFLFGESRERPTRQSFRGDRKPSAGAEPVRSTDDVVGIVSLDRLGRPYVWLQLCERLLRSGLAASLALIIVFLGSAVRESFVHPVPILVMLVLWAAASLLSALVARVTYAALRALWQGSVRAAWTGVITGVVIVPWSLVGWFLDIHATHLRDGTVWFYVAGALEQMLPFLTFAAAGAILLKFPELRQLRPKIPDSRTTAWQVSGIIRPDGSPWRAFTNKAFVLSFVALIVEGGAFYWLNESGSSLVRIQDIDAYLPRAKTAVEAHYLHLATVSAFIAPLSLLWMRHVLRIAAWVRTRARRAALLSAAEALALDRRPPVLFLRPFADDQVSLASVPLSFLAGLFDPISQQTHVEALLETCVSLGPAVSIGRPDDDAPPVGVPRAYVGADWQAAVTTLMDAASLIVIAISDSPGIAWEVDQIAARGHARKTIVVMPPGRSHDRDVLLHIVTTFTPTFDGREGRDAFVRGLGNDHVIGVLAPDQQPRVLTVRGTPSPADYELALRIAVRDLYPSRVASPTRV
jgi:hypothetical protein